MAASASMASGMGNSFFALRQLGKILGATQLRRAAKTFCDVPMAAAMRFHDAELTPPGRHFLSYFRAFAYFLCGIHRAAQFRLPGGGAAAITPALGANFD